MSLPSSVHQSNDITPTSNKRHTKNTKNNAKRLKQHDAQLNQNLLKSETDNEQINTSSDYDNSNLKAENAEVTNEDNKNSIFQNYWDNIMLATPNDSNTADQGNF